MTFLLSKKDGQYVYVDWLPQKEADSSKLTSKLLKDIIILLIKFLIISLLLASKAEWYSAVLDGPVVAMKRSPFFKDILLIAGGTGFNIWREKTFVNN